MKTISKYGTAVVLVHQAIAILHGMAHGNLHIGLSAPQELFVLIVITVCPLIAMALLWTRRRRVGAVLLAVSMGASLLFGVWNHFVAAGPDHVAEVASGTMGRLFQMTAVLLALIEAAGCWLGFAWLRRAPLR
jgi:hypothetical protein